ncbi:MAG: TonB-dependent receptor [Bacteroidales bacterium]|nr:TonB-dependent receptor [Bacteroidales bacterium]
MKKIYFIVISSLILLMVTNLSGQEYRIFGNVTDKDIGDGLYGANIMLDNGTGVSTDIEGAYTLNVKPGKYTITVSFVGYETISKSVEISNSNLRLDFSLSPFILQEITIIADVAKQRETPVAFSSIKPQMIEEELGQQDIPMLLNNTPGAYATQQGGGDGDARITIRGFSQRNIAIMIDGVPVNDMENGWVYWSNWFGLDDVTRNIQIQRGLASSKLALPSVGGTMNIITKGIENNRSASIKQEVGSDMYLRTSLMVNSGTVGNGWGFTAAGSYKQRDGWVDQTWSNAGFYYLKIQKKTGNHLISVDAMGAPQSHAQKKYKSEIDRYSKEYAQSLGIDTDYYINNSGDSILKENTGRGLRYNPYWGYLDRWTTNDNGDTIYNGKEMLSEKINYFHKPMFTIRDFWTVSDKLYISNIAYLSIGKGGGTGLDTQSGVDYDENGQLDFQKIYNKNRVTRWGDYLDGFPDGYQSNNFLRSSNNEHFWYGLLSTVNYSISDKLQLSSGLDLRSYRGSHYEEIIDLLGGDYTIETVNKTSTNKFKTEGDIISYHNDGLVNWGGAFTQLKYKNGRSSTFLNLTGSYSGYKRIDYFKKMDLVFEDTIMQQAVGYTFDNLVDATGHYDTVYYKGEAYTMKSPNARNAATNWFYVPGFTVKAGYNFNITEKINAFTNFGYMSNAPKFNNIYDYDNNLYEAIENERVKAVELGMAYYSKSFSAQLNTYYTVWENKPSSGFSYEYRDPITDMVNFYYVNINGMNATHKGAEFDFIYMFSDKLDIQGLVSIGDWRWASEDSVKVYDRDQQYVQTIYYNAKNIMVGDAAQSQYALSLRYEPIKNLYFKASYRYFDRHFADFNPLDLDPVKKPYNFDDNGNPMQSWQLPDYGLLDLYLGYGRKIGNQYFKVSFGVLNALNEIYISDATNNDTYNEYNYSDFDAKSASVFLGMGRRFNASIKVTF